MKLFWLERGNWHSKKFASTKALRAYMAKYRITHHFWQFPNNTTLREVKKVYQRK